MDSTKICKQCGRILPLDKFRLVKGQFSNPYYKGKCKECEYKNQRKNIEEKKRVKIDDDIEILIQRKYKEIKPERILDISDMDIQLCGLDEIFVNVTDYKNIWISNYGRAISYAYGTYNLLNGDHDAYGALRYTANKIVYDNGCFTTKRCPLYASKTVVQEFVVDPDVANNIFIWHKGNDKQDCYYKHLYPLNKNQYYAVKYNFNTTGNDSEEFIIRVMNDIKYKPDDWSRKSMNYSLNGVGYQGSANVDIKSRSYKRWSDMIHRCYNIKFLERMPRYQDCEVCEEWLNYCNFRKWYDEHFYQIENEQMDLDKDILYKGNKVYSPATCCITPHGINTLFINGKKDRGDYPVGVWYEEDKEKFRAAMNYGGHQIKLGTFASAEDAFARYKEYKEDFIKDIAEQYKGKIPDNVYEAMMNWKIEITD